MLLRQRNPLLRLTGLRDPREVAVKHFLDCALVPSLVSLPSPLMDLGTGAGFPGVVIKVLCPPIQVVLAEERIPKITFLEEVVETLGLEGVEIYPHRVTSQFPGRVNGVITRAVEPIATTLRRVQGFLAPGGLAIFMKGPAVDPEIIQASRLRRSPYVLREDRSYRLPGASGQRRLLVYERTAP